MNLTMQKVTPEQVDALHAILEQFILRKLLLPEI